MAATAMAEKPTIHLGDEDLTIDTIFHATVGPGTTQTQLHLTGRFPLDIFYLTVDRSTPGVSMHVVCPGGHTHGTSQTSKMAQNNSNENTLYFAGTNGDFYYTSGTSTDGVSLVGTPTYSAAVQGEVYRSSGSGYQFSIDAENIARVCRLSWHNGFVTNAAGESVPLRAVNNDAPNNAVTLYNHRGWTSPCQGGYAGSCAEVGVRLVEGSTFQTSGTMEFEVITEPTSTGDLRIPEGDDGAVLMARGSATGFINALHTGDRVSVVQTIETPEGQTIIPTEIVSGNPKNVGGGVNLQSEAERGDASDRHPRTGIGISEDGNTIIMMVVDGRGASKGVTTGMLGDLMLRAGAYEAVNLDGGGSSTLYTAALGVRNNTSDGNERSVGNGIFAVYNGDATDTSITRLEFSDWRFDSPEMGLYTPRIFAFNAAGILVDTDYKDYTLTVTDGAGEIINNGKTFFANGTTHGVLTVSAEGKTGSSIPIYLTPTPTQAKRTSVLLDGVTTYTVELEAEVRGIKVPVNPQVYAWESSDLAVATIDAGGVVTPVGDGTCTVTGRRGDESVSLTVVVQRAPAAAVPFEEDASAWSVKKTGVGELTVSPFEKGFVLDYKMGSNPRNPKITLNNAKTIYGRPDAMRIVMQNAATLPSQVSVAFKFDNSSQAVVVPVTEFSADGPTTAIVNFADYADLADFACWPMTFSYLSVSIADGKNATGHIEFPAVELLYTSDPSGISTPVVEAIPAGDDAWFTIEGIALPAQPTEAGLYIHRTPAGTSKVVVQ